MVNDRALSVLLIPAVEEFLPRQTAVAVLDFDSPPQP